MSGPTHLYFHLLAGTKYLKGLQIKVVADRRIQKIGAVEAGSL